MLEGRSSQYPQFQCPNCRAYADLEADVDVDMEDWAEDDSAGQEGDENHVTEVPVVQEPEIIDQSMDNEGDETSLAPEINGPASSSADSPSHNLLSRRNEKHPPVDDTAPVNSIPMPERSTDMEMRDHLARQRLTAGSPSAEQTVAGEGPLTPRNNAGPFVFDGSGRSGSRRNLVPPVNISEVSDGTE